MPAPTSLQKQEVSMPVTIIAEAGVIHYGSLEMAKVMARVA